MRFFLLHICFFLFIQLADAQSNNSDFTVITTFDTIYVTDVSSGFKYKKVVNTPDTIYFNAAGFVFDQTNIDKMPLFVGGTRALITWLNENFHYPDIARANNIQGKVNVRFIVDADGNIIEPEILEPIHELLDAEALRLINAMPKWNAGERAGTKVRCYFTLPVNFKLGE